ncbi:MAG: hypothetical protein M3N21_09385 [Actinomycetota bacterium]|nr:hypothetical protein [Actinomycetota bacterium]
MPTLPSTLPIAVKALSWLTASALGRAVGASAASSDDDPERGDIPGWVLITIMTAGLVTAVWSVADGQLRSILNHALNSVRNP